jgi:hypothetical protein
VQLGTAPSRAAALARLQAFRDVPHVRAERRRSGWQLRAGAWTSRADAEAALPALRAQGAKNARVLKMETNVPWLLPVATATAATSPEVATPAPAPAPAAVAIPIPPPRSATPARVRFSDRYHSQAEKYATETQRLLQTSGAVRRDGFLYAMDIAPLLLYAAERGDLALYRLVLPFTQPLVMRAASGPYTEGFVLWRHKDGVRPEVSGATEAGWMARALWTGARAFDRPDDRALATKILEGYAKHAFEQNNVWFVRKYFAFEGGQFANLSVLGNYTPDFLDDVERENRVPAIRGLAERAYALLERARLGTGLLNPLIVPEIGATYPGQGVEVFAPNGLTSLAESCDAAEAAVRGRPKLAQGVLDFVGKRGRRHATGRLYAYFDAGDGGPRGAQTLSTTGYACLGQLAAMLGDNGAWDRLEPQLLLDMETLPSMALSSEAPLYAAGPLLRAALAAGAYSR